MVEMVNHILNHLHTFDTYQETTRRLEQVMESTAIQRVMYLYILSRESLADANEVMRLKLLNDFHLKEKLDPSMQRYLAEGEVHSNSFNKKNHTHTRS